MRALPLIACTLLVGAVACTGADTGSGEAGDIDAIDTDASIGETDSADDAQTDAEGDMGETPADAEGDVAPDAQSDAESDAESDAGLDAHSDAADPGDADVALPDAGGDSDGGETDDTDPADAGDTGTDAPGDVTDAGDTDGASDADRDGSRDGDATDFDADAPPACVPAATARHVRFLPDAAYAGFAPEAIGVANIRAGAPGAAQFVMTEPLRPGVRLISGCTEAGCAQTDVPSGALVVPARAQQLDLDGDRDLDVLVADLGAFFTSDARLGAVRGLINDGEGGFSDRLVLGDLRRTACAEAVDLDQDGLLEVFVCEFGNFFGALRRLDLDASGTVVSNEVLDPRPGTIHAFAFDADADGDLDLATALSQTYEEIHLYRNDAGALTREVLVDWDDPGRGLAGIVLDDLDQDGDTDILYTTGDTLDYDDAVPGDPWSLYRIGWLENDGGGTFADHDLAGIWGSYSPAVADFDLDCDRDIFVGTVQVPRLFPDALPYATMWLRNDGPAGFVLLPAAPSPAGIVTAVAVDLDADGAVDVLGGVLDPEGLETAHLVAFFNRVDP